PAPPPRSSAPPRRRYPAWSGSSCTLRRSEIGVPVGATCVVRGSAMWFVCLLAMLLLWAAPARADSMEDETVALVKRVDFDPNQAVRDGEADLKLAEQSG